MVTLYRLFTRYTPRGRREARARKWDSIADRMASQKQLYRMSIAASSLMGMTRVTDEHFRLQYQKVSLAEQAARDMAAAIRKGER